jgi:predicted ester cyclase
MTSEEKIKDLIIHFLGELDQGGETALRALSKYQSENIKFHMATKEIQGLENYYPLFNVYQSAFKNMKHEIKEISVCNDLATIRLIFKADSVDRFMGLPPTHKRVVMPIIETMRVKDNKIVEVWNYYDGLMGLIQQLEGEIRPKLMHVLH